MSDFAASGSAIAPIERATVTMLAAEQLPRSQERAR